jgi:hypothetical protein
MSASCDEQVQLEAFRGLLPSVDAVKSFYDLSGRMGSDLPKLLNFLAGWCRR